MKIIDETGKIFGRINLLDFLVILLLLCILPAFYVGHKIVNRKAVVEKLSGERLEIEVKCLFIKLKPEVLKLISVGDKALNENGKVIGEIISLGKSKSYKYRLDIGKGEDLVLKKDVPLKQLEATLKLNAVVRENLLFYEHDIMKIGSLFEFHTNKYTITTLLPGDFIKAVKETRAVILREKWIDLFITLKDLEEDILKQICVGDKEKDEAGGTIAEILSLGAIEKSSHEFSVGIGNFVTAEDSEKKQVSTKMKLRCQIKDDEALGKQIYFKGNQIEYNKAFEFKTDKYKAEGMVTKTFEVISPLREKWISLQLKLTGVVSEVASVIQKGDVEKNLSNEVVAKIASTISTEPSQVLTLKENEIIGLNHPFNKDILLSLNVKCTAKEGIYYFKNYPVKMGNNLTFTTDLYSVSGTIVGMEIK